MDDIHYQLLKNLPDSALLVLLQVYNNIWDGGTFLSSWREAVIIPIPKPGKDSNNHNSYRPNALTSRLCKTMERMVNACLMWFLESQGLLTKVQCGFRRNYSMLDHLVRFESFI